MHDELGGGALLACHANLVGSVMHGHSTYRTCNAKGHVGEVRQLGKMLASIGLKSRRDLLYASRQIWRRFA
ncbi:MAG: hypothetical protein ABF572_13805 [Gluconobacter sp.]|uniref:hypothetical protein n=1 Tax=Gluconobacter sp. TaxID=1876758 RepID=UPI0039EB5B6C